MQNELSRFAHRKSTSAVHNHRQDGRLDYRRAKSILRDREKIFKKLYEQTQIRSFSYKIKSISRTRCKRVVTRRFGNETVKTRKSRIYREKSYLKSSADTKRMMQWIKTATRRLQHLFIYCPSIGIAYPHYWWSSTTRNWPVLCPCRKNHKITVRERELHLKDNWPLDVICYTM